MPGMHVWLGPAITAGLVLINLAIVISSQRRHRQRARARGQQPARMAGLGFVLVGGILVAGQLGLNLLWPHLGDIVLGVLVLLGISRWIIKARDDRSR